MFWKIVEGDRDIKYVNMAHSDMFLSVESLKNSLNICILCCKDWRRCIGRD